MNRAILKSPIENHPGQLLSWLDPARFKVHVCGRRWGKTVKIRERLCKVSEKRNSQYAYIAPTRFQAKDLMWDPLLERFDQFKWRHKANVSELSIIRLGSNSKIMLKSAEVADRMRGLSLDGAFFDEFQDQGIDIWQKIVRPALSDKRGFAEFYGTPKGYNHFYELYQMAKSESDWASFLFHTKDSPFFQTPEGLAEIDAARRVLDLKTFRQEYEASFETYGGRIIYAFDRARHKSDLTYDPTLPLRLGMDFNRNPMTAVAFHNVGGKTIAVKELFILTSSTQEMCDIIKTTFPNWRNQNVTIRPDATGARRTSNTNRSDHEIIRDNGFKVEVNLRNPYRTDRWAACNKAFEEDLALINLSECPKLVKELETISYKEGTCEIDLKSDPLLGHLFDSFGYNIVTDHPVIKPKQMKIY